jgi:hypothetical protein
MTEKQWNVGDRVIHASKPEWGAGVITAAEKSVHDGRPCQRLTVRFDRAGVRTLTTAFADLRPADEAPSLAPTTESDDQAGWLNRLSADSPVEVLTRLPEAATDPFSSLASRLKASLDLYRFNDTGGSLLDWAAMQSGLKDPLARFNRHELEQIFRRFAAVRDEHFKKLAIEIKRREPAVFQQAMKSAAPAVQQALRRLDIGR